MVLPWHNIIRSRIAAEALVSPPPEPEPEWVTRGADRLPESVIDRLALLIHERWHGDHTPANYTKAECARLSGAYADILAIEPAILELIREAS